jgi:hypothetical protein
VTAAHFGALIEAVQRAGLQHGGQRGFNERPARGGGAALGHPPAVSESLA